MLSLEDCYNNFYSVEAYLYNVLATSLPSHGFKLYPCVSELFKLDNGYLDKIINDFINGNDLSIYNNYNGKCIVSYKPLLVSADGWMKTNSEGDYIECWSTYMNEEDYYKYHYE